MPTDIVRCSECREVIAPGDSFYTMQGRVICFVCWGLPTCRAGGS